MTKLEMYAVKKLMEEIFKEGAGVAFFLALIHLKMNLEKMTL